MQRVHAPARLVMMAWPTTSAQHASIVAAGAASRCEIQVAYAIGMARPMSVLVETFGTETVDKAAIEKAKDMTEKAKTSEQKIQATEAMTRAKEQQKAGRLAVQKESHLYSSAPSVESVKKRILTWTEKIRKLELDIRNKDDNKEVALGTELGFRGWLKHARIAPRERDGGQGGGTHG